MQEIMSRLIDRDLRPSGSGLSPLLMRRVTREPEQFGGHRRLTPDVESFQVLGEGGVVYAESVGDGSKRSSCSVLDSHQVNFRGVQAALHRSGSGV